jgi:hypothetical protein
MNLNVSLRDGMGPIDTEGLQNPGEVARKESSEQSDAARKFAKGENKELQGKLEGLNEAAMWSFGLSLVAGIIGAITCGPVGWAALGLLAVGGACLLLRHAVQKHAGMETDFKENIKENISTLAGILGRIG